MRRLIERCVVPVALALCVTVGFAQTTVTKPRVSEEASPVEEISVVAWDGHTASAVVRKPPGNGPFPAIVILHGGLQTPYEMSKMRTYIRNNAFPLRSLAAGYVAVFLTYRNRSGDPQSPIGLWDVLAIVDHVMWWPEVDPKSVVVYGCSAGGDLALEVGRKRNIAAIAAEEPGVIFFSGMLSRKVPKKGEKYEVPDIVPVFQNPHKFYTAELRKRIQTKISEIRCPIFISQGDKMLLKDAELHTAIDEILIPELKAGGKELKTKIYQDVPHCGLGLRTYKEAGLEFFSEMDQFFRQYLPTQPEGIDEAYVTMVPEREVLPEQ